MLAHSEKLPKPERIPRLPDSLEARLNATNDALQPSAGGIVEFWSDPIEGEIRDDQGIGLHNPDTDVFMEYTLAGPMTPILRSSDGGDSRESAYEHMAEVLRASRLQVRIWRPISLSITDLCTGSSAAR